MERASYIRKDGSLWISSSLTSFILARLSKRKYSENLTYQAQLVASLRSRSVLGSLRREDVDEIVHTAIPYSQKFASYLDVATGHNSEQPIG